MFSDLKNNVDLYFINYEIIITSKLS